MGDALFDLEQVLRSNKERLTLQEANLLMAWRAQAIRDFTVGFGGGTIVTWLATKRLRHIFRLNLTVGAAAVCGLWRFNSSVQSSVQHMLSLEGSRIQRELAGIMLKKYYHNPWALQYLSKHFYSEEVYDDSSVDRPIFRWRYRNFSGEHVSHSESTSHSEQTDSGKNEHDVKKTTVDTKQVYLNVADDATGDPFDLVFGLSESAENVPQPDDALKTLPRKQKRKEKRSRRKHRRHHHHHEDESDY